MRIIKFVLGVTESLIALVLISTAVFSPEKLANPDGSFSLGMAMFFILIGTLFLLHGLKLLFNYKLLETILYRINKQKFDHTFSEKTGKVLATLLITSGVLAIIAVPSLTQKTYAGINYAPISFLVGIVLLTLGGLLIKKSRQVYFLGTIIFTAPVWVILFVAIYGTISINEGGFDWFMYVLVQLSISGIFTMIAAITTLPGLILFYCAWRLQKQEKIVG